mmetsp:Transcript_25659/g.38089  ORF Transcript_25659/g.38089 Transcript_25659/m.38089 type:complete len:140 (-) Transcript_25659:430-849(-)
MKIFINNLARIFPAKYSKISRDTALEDSSSSSASEGEPHSAHLHGKQQQAVTQPSFLTHLKDYFSAFLRASNLVVDLGEYCYYKTSFSAVPRNLTCQVEPSTLHEDTGDVAAAAAVVVAPSSPYQVIVGDAAALQLTCC